MKKAKKETLSAKQARFTFMVADLIKRAKFLDYRLTLGDAYRDPRTYRKNGAKIGYSRTELGLQKWLAYIENSLITSEQFDIIGVKFLIFVLNDYIKIFAGLDIQDNLKLEMFDAIKECQDLQDNVVDTEIKQATLRLVELAIEAENEAIGLELWTEKKNSCHKVRLAIDLNLFKKDKQDRWRYCTSTKSHQELGVYWESIGGSWGGRFNDGNHYSLEHQGTR